MEACVAKRSGYRAHVWQGWVHWREAPAACGQGATGAAVLLLPVGAALALSHESLGLPRLGARRRQPLCLDRPRVLPQLGAQEQHGDHAAIDADCSRVVDARRATGRQAPRPATTAAAGCCTRSCACPPGVQGNTATAIAIFPLTGRVERVFLGQPPPRVGKLRLGVPLRPLRLVCSRGRVRQVGRLSPGRAAGLAVAETREAGSHARFSSSTKSSGPRTHEHRHAAAAQHKGGKRERQADVAERQHVARLLHLQQR